MRSRLILLPLLALAVGIYYWQNTTPASHAPAATWRVGLGADVKQGLNFHEFAAESKVRLSVTCTEPGYLYVFSHTAEDGTLLLFPSPGLESDLGNPLPAGRSVLPGKREGDDLAWTTRSGIISLTTYIAVASRQPITELEELAGRLRFWSNTVFPDHSMVVTKSEVGGEVDGKPRAPLPNALLREAAELTNATENPNGPMQPAKGRTGIWLSAWKIKERKKAKPAPK